MVDRRPKSPNIEFAQPLANTQKGMAWQREEWLRLGVLTMILIANGVIVTVMADKYLMDRIVPSNDETVNVIIGTNHTTTQCHSQAECCSMVSNLVLPPIIFWMCYSVVFVFFGYILLVIGMKAREERNQRIRKQQERGYTLQENHDEEEREVEMTERGPTEGGEEKGRSPV